MAGFIWEYLQAASVLMGDITVCCLALGIAPLIGGFPLVYAPWAWFLVLAIQLLLGLWLLHRGTSWTVYLIVQGIATVLGVVMACLMFLSSDYIPDFQVCFGTAALVTGMHAAYAAYRPPKANLIVGYVDVIVVMFIFYLYVEFYMGHTEISLWMLAVATVVFDLVVVNHLRTEAETGHRISGAGSLGKMILIALPVIFLAVTGLAVGAASGQIHSFVDVLIFIGGKVMALISVVFSAFAYIVANIILFFLRLIPNSPAPAVEEAAFDTEEELVYAEDAAGILPAWLLPLLFALIVGAAVIWGLYLLRNTHIQSGRIRMKNRKVVKRSYFLSSIADLLKRAAAFISFEWDCLRYRRTLQGLYVMAERRGARIKVKKKDSESPGAYLRRLEMSISRERGSCAEAGFDLVSLASMLDDEFYGGTHVDLDREQYEGYARSIHQLS